MVIDPTSTAGAASVWQNTPYEAAVRPLPAAPEDGKSFGQFLSDALGGVNALQQTAGQVVQQFATGAPMDVHQVMIAVEQASTALALTTQVRNKLIDAYTEVMRTQV